MQRALNIKNFRTFAQQLKGRRMTEITVTRATGPRGARLKYSARDPRSGQTFNGEWVVPQQAGGTPDAAAEKEFFDMASKEFVVTQDEASK